MRSSTRRQRVTLQNVAEASGVTAATVSLVLNGRGRISVGQRRRIIAISRDLGYRPNLAARLLRSNQPTDIGLIINGPVERVIGSGYSQPIMTEFIAKCQRENLRHQVEFYDAAANLGVAPSLLCGGVLGGAMHVGQIGIEEAAWLEANPDFPLVEIGEPFRHSVRVRIDQGVQRAVQHLFALGHRQVALLHGTTEYDVYRHAVAGFKQGLVETAMPGHRMAELTVDNDCDTAAAALAWMDKALAGNAFRPTAVIAGDMRFARGIIYGVMRRGLRVPEDLSVISLGSRHDAEKGLPAITTIELDSRQVVAEALAMLRSLIGRQEVSDPHRWCETRFVERDSVAPPPASNSRPGTGS